MIRARGLGRSFGDRDVLRGLALDVPAGGFMLVTGGNGSGKSTLLMLMAGLLAPTAGTLEVGVSRARVGYLGHDPLVYRELTALENLDLYAQLYRVPDRTARIRQLLTQYGLSGVERERVGRFSRGMSQRLALCRVMLHDPELVLLDEPHASLDDDGAALLDEELARVAGAKTIVVSSHDPARLEPLATLRLRL
jgi:heme exporter protein A